MSDPTACSVAGCGCTAYEQPTEGTACARAGCGHASSKHTGK